MRGHDMIVVGASAGGVQALIDLVGRLPADLPAAVFVVLHTASRAPNVLPMILARHASMEVLPARDGDVIQPGRIYVASPDCHLTLEPGRIRLDHGPKQHHTRPAVDPLFRSAAEVYGPRVVGVVLTGAGANGVRGMLAIKQHGGLTMIQDPEEALWPSMPASTREAVGVDYVLPIAELARVLVDRARDPVEEEGTKTLRGATDHAAPITVRTEPEGSSPAATALPAPEFAPACPECGDFLILLEPGELGLFCCPAGHSFAADELLGEQAEALERALWVAHRVARQHVLLAEWLAARGVAGGDPQTLSWVHGRGRLARHSAAALVALLHFNGLEPGRSEKASGTPTDLRR